MFVPLPEGTPMRPASKPILVALDLNATRVQAVSDAGDGEPEALLLEGMRADLPLAVCLEGRHMQVGSAGLAHRRAVPHFVCLGFLPHLGTTRTWTAGRHRLDASKALGLVFDHLQPACSQAKGILLVLPAYLNETQRQAVLKLAEKARWKVLGTVAAPLAAILAGQTDRQPWSGLTFVLDADEHAMTWSAVTCVDGQARLLATQTQSRLSTTAWMERLLDSVADRCVRQSRRDPRDSAPTEQALYDQLDAALDLCQSRQMADLVIQTANWCQNLVWRPDDPATACAPLAAQALDEMRDLEEQHGSPVHVLVTAAAARLPGLVPLLNEALWQPTPEEVIEMKPSSDFGEGLMQDDAPSTAHAPLTVLAARSPTLAAHTVLVRLFRNELPRGNVSAVPLPEPQPNDAGPVRLHFDGQDYALDKTAFTLGRHPECNLVFESEHFPTVSARHCEVVFDRQMYVLHDHSRNGTLVNERPIMDEMPLQPGDWIRLGPGGPLLQFLGQPSESRRTMRSG
jgi:hypothetical protein